MKKNKFGGFVQMSSIRVSSEQIKQGNIYEAAIPFSDGRPLTFFEADPKLGENIGRAVKKDHGFEPEYDKETRTNKARIVSVIVKHKTRLCVVLQNDLFNENENYDHVYVAPIATIHPREEKTELIERLKEKNDIPQLHYIDSHTGRPAYVNIGDIKRIHKSLILKTTSHSPLSSKAMRDISQKIQKLMGVNENSERIGRINTKKPE
ncbi:type II toxin-antitoxin system PemK/MazF family toxin [Bacillus cereus]|nr:type II toxin-antitoxin system PemK/MazF family toxin [Bacillus cereus]MDF9574919.1 type II toxin-antitoxin system PemK/MazF family toxin [Bacillus cereus]